MKGKIITIFLSLAMLNSISNPLSAKEINSTKNLERIQAIQKLKELNNGNIKMSEKSGQAFISGKLSSKQIPGEVSAKKFLEDNKVLFGINNIANDLQLSDIRKDEIGDTYVKFVQVINGIKVKDSLINVHYDKNGVIVSVNGKLEENKNITTLGSMKISESEAIEIAKKQFDYESLRNTPKIESLLLTKDNKIYETFKVNISYIEPTITNYDIYIEAYSGDIIQMENNIRYDGVSTGSGIDVLGSVRTLNLYLSGNIYQMRDISNPATIKIDTYSFNNTTTTNTLVSNSTNIFNAENHKASVSAHYNARKVIDFYKNLFNRNSLDNSGMTVRSYTNYGNSYNNAFWTGYEMVYGDGDGKTFTYLSGDLDVVGHEMTHGVISNTANLAYHNQSGSLNESMADVFGVFISTYDKYNVATGGNWNFNISDWVIGDDIYTPNISGDALRSLSNPTLYNQPDNMRDYKFLTDTVAGDYGGVHINSGIVNKAAYLIASNIGMEKTAKIYYRALSNYMDADTDFEGARDCLIQAATDLYGDNSIEIKAIDDAYINVGVVQADTYESNDTIQTSYPIEFGATYQSYISDSFDVDYYKLVVNNTGNISIELSNLPSDYDLELYNSSGELVEISSNYDTVSEFIDYNAPEIGNYYIKVITSIESSMTKQYSLTVTKPANLSDLDGDGLVNIVDIALIAQYYNSTLGDNIYKNNLDLNQDNIIDIFDIILISKELK